MKKVRLNSFQIKMAALVFMVMDHCGEFLFPDIRVLRWVGRLSAPLFLFCAVHAVDHTRNKGKYLLRLYCFSVLMEAVWCVLSMRFHYVRFYPVGNIFATLFIIVALICILNKLKIRYAVCLILLWQALSYLVIWQADRWGVGAGLGLLITALTGNMFQCEYGVWWVVLGLVMYYTKNSRKRLAIGYGLVCFGMWFLTATALFARAAIRIKKVAPALEGMAEFACQMFTGSPSYFNSIVPHGLYLGSNQWMMFFSLPVMFLYNGEKGRSWKWFFYIFYPVHMVLLLWISS